MEFMDTNVSDVTRRSCVRAGDGITNQNRFSVHAHSAKGQHLMESLDLRRSCCEALRERRRNVKQEPAERHGRNRIRKCDARGKGVQLLSNILRLFGFLTHVF